MKQIIGDLSVEEFAKICSQHLSCRSCPFLGVHCVDEPDDYDGQDIESATYDELELQNALDCLKE